ncbi:DNRLRE domain-containing protein [Paenibacillus sp. GD4]|uniref:CBM96 family carbohydrate-binding protein n=1 Tax=Paenibacillus sp. GD4 TaxID=3068890 RepID=UPI002796B09F|nr:DNRLRE domain-containing protein [Paenibacillus sp. GD4]MDQ1912676.1 DNRLRE domain-containing protein [Paenibacillus sp. GD4]
MKGLRSWRRLTHSRILAAMLTAALLCTAAAYECSLVFAAEAGTLSPTDDTYVNAGSKSEQNFGASADLLVKYQAADPNVTRQAFLRFDLKPYSLETIGSAKLRIYGSVTEPGVTSVGISVLGGEQDGWSESTMNWGSKPEAEYWLGQFAVTPTARWHEVDVTSFIRKQAQGDGSATLILTQETSPGYVTTFKSKESSAYQPQLVISGAPAMPEMPTWPSGSSLTGGGAAGSNLALQWTPADHQTQVMGYRVYRNGTLLQTLPGTSREFMVTGLQSGKPYTFQIQAGDADGHWTTDGPLYSTTQTKVPTDDAYGNAGSAGDRNFGQTVDLLVKNNVPDLTRRSYLRFDLNGVRTEDIGSAKLMIYGAITEPGPTSLSTSVAGGERHDWTEQALTWNNKPETEHFLGRFDMNRTMRWNQIDVTSYIRKQASEGGYATLSLFQDINPGYATVFKSKEDIHKPYLLISALPSDLQAPHWPQGSKLEPQNVQETSLALTWTKPQTTGGADVSAYRVYKDGELLQELPAAASPSIAVSDLKSNQSYTFQVQAGDSAGRWSTDGPFVTVRTSGNELLQVRLGNVFVQPDPVQFRIRTGRSTVNWLVEDAWGREVTRGASPVSGGELELSIPLEQKGYFTMKVSLEAPGLQPVVLSTPFAVLSSFDLNQVQDSPFGFATHLHRTGFGWGADLIDLIKYSGAKNVRDGIEWNGIEKQKGVYTFSPVPDNYMTKLKEQQENMLFVAGYNNPLYDNNSTPYTDEGREGFARYAKSYFDHYGSQLKWLEVYNEFNIGFGDRGNGPADSRPDYYYPLLKKTFETVKAERPDVTIVGMATAGVPLTWMEDVFKLGGLQYMDAISIHPYQYPAAPEGLTEQLENVKQLIRKYNNGQLKPVWITEFGWPTHLGGRGTEELPQADYLVRGHVLALASGIEKIFWYDFMNDGTKIDYNEDNFGVIRNASDAQGKHTPKPAYAAYAAMTRQLTGAEYVAKDTTQEGVYSYSFRKDNSDIRVAWSISPQAMAIATTQPLEITDIMGNTKVYEPLHGKVYVTLNGEPVYIKGTIQGMVPDDTFIVTSSDQAVLTEPVQLGVRLTNPLGEPLTVTLSSENQTMELTAGPNATVNRTMQLGAMDRLGVKRIQGDLHSGGKRIGYVLRQVRIGEPYAVRVRPVIEDEASRSGSLRVDITNHFSAKPLKVVKVDWEMGSRTGTTNVAKVIAPATKETFSWEAATVEYGKSYTFKATVWLEGFGPIPVSGTLEFNPVAHRTIQVDGTIDEALDEALIDLSKANNKISGYSGPADASGLVWVHWDREHFYMTAKITDNVWAYPAGGGDQWQNDGIQFALAPGIPGESKQWYEYGVAQTPAGPQIYRFLSPSGYSTGLVDKGNLRISRDEAQQTTLYELALPWSELAPIRSEANEAVSFSLLLNDNDGVQRKGYIEWGSGIGGTKEPKLFRTLEWMKQGTQLVLEQAEGTYSDSVELKASLTDANGKPIAGETVEFQVEQERIGSAVTDHAGVATMRYTIQQAADSTADAGEWPIRAEYQGSTSESKLIVRKEQAFLRATDPQVFAAGGLQTIEVTLQQDDAELGRREGIPVTALVTRIHPDGSRIAVSVTEAVYATDEAGIAHIPAQLPAGLYEIRFDIQPNAYYQTTSAVVTAAVYDRTQRGLDMNGFIPLDEAGSLFGPKAKKLHVNIHWEQQAGGSLTGQLRLHAEPLGLELRGETVEWLVIEGDQTYWQTTATDPQGNRYRVRMMAVSEGKNGKEAALLSLQLWGLNGSGQEPLYSTFVKSFQGTFQR